MSGSVSELIEDGPEILRSRYRDRITRIVPVAGVLSVEYDSGRVLAVPESWFSKYLVQLGPHGWMACYWPDRHRGASDIGDADTEEEAWEWVRKHFEDDDRRRMEELYRGM